MRQYLCLKGDRHYKAGCIYPDTYGHGPCAGKGSRMTWKGDFVEVETFEQDGQTWIKHDGGECPVPDGWEIQVLHRDGLITDQDHENARCEWYWSDDEADFHEVSEDYCVAAYSIISTGENEQPKAPSITAADPSPDPVEVTIDPAAGKDWTAAALKFGRLYGEAQKEISVSEASDKKSFAPTDFGVHVTSVSVGGKPARYSQSGDTVILYGYDANFNKVSETVNVPDCGTPVYVEFDVVLSPAPDIGYYILDDESEAYDERLPSPQEAAYAEKIAALQPEPEAPRVFPGSALRDMTDKTFASLLGMGQFIGGGE